MVLQKKVIYFSYSYRSVDEFAISAKEPRIGGKVTSCVADAVSQMASFVTGTELTHSHVVVYRMVKNEPSTESRTSNDFMQ